MTAEPSSNAEDLVTRLRAEGHDAAADRLQRAIAGPHHGGALLHALRDACQAVLTAIEALDPKTQLMAEELRLEIDKKLL